MFAFVRFIAYHMLLGAAIWLVGLALYEPVTGVPAVFAAPAPQLEIELPLPEPPPVEVTAPAARLNYRQERLLVHCAGVLCEGVANATPPLTPFSAFSKQFLKQFGVQLQVATLTDAGLISTDPAVSFVQGFLIGL